MRSKISRVSTAAPPPAGLNSRSSTISPVLGYTGSQVNFTAHTPFMVHQGFSIHIEQSGVKMSEHLGQPGAERKRVEVSPIHARSAYIVVRGFAQRHFV